MHFWRGIVGEWKLKKSSNQPRQQKYNYEEFFSKYYNNRYIVWWKQHKFFDFTATILEN
jgi:hypothetical protein